MRSLGVSVILKGVAMQRLMTVRNILLLRLNIYGFSSCLNGNSPESLTRQKNNKKKYLFVCNFVYINTQLLIRLFANF
jgi:hypothetical protein